jgi:CPA1 family monovalent cation:H+ antiporter
MGIGRLLALTSNNEVNSLAALHFPEIFSRAEVYQLPLTDGKIGHDHTPQYLSGRFLFNADMTFSRLSELFMAGSVIKATKLTETFDYIDYQTEYDNKAIPLFLITRAKELLIYTLDYQPLPKAGQTLITLVPSAGMITDSTQATAASLSTDDSSLSPSPTS